MDEVQKLASYVLKRAYALAMIGEEPLVAVVLMGSDI